MTRPAEGDGRHRADDAVHDDEAIETVRSEQRAVVGTATRVTGRVRLEKRVVEEERTITVRLRHEQVRTVRLDADGAEVTPDGAGLRATPWVVLHEERPVISTVVVPVERVRLVVAAVPGSSSETIALSREVVEVEVEVDGAPD